VPVNRSWRAPTRAQRVVVKLGTNVVTRDGSELALGRVSSLIEGLAQLQRGGREVLLVSSGSVAMGTSALGLDERPRSLGLRQACAAAGQGKLIGFYGRCFAQFGIEVAQVLLTEEDLADPDRALCIRTTLLRLIERGVVPVLNENDSVSVRELVEHRRREGASPRSPSIAFGDNDGLSARIAVALDADLLILLTDVDALYTANPHTDPKAERIDQLSGVSDEILARAGGASSSGTGGMASKLASARVATEAGVDVVIASGGQSDVLEQVLAGAEIGTMIEAVERRAGRKRRIALSRACRGSMTINDGARTALVERKASLLPIGVQAVEGTFERGDVVELRDASGRALGRGIANYDAQDCVKMAGKHSDEMLAVIGWRGYDALVTRDNLVLSEVGFDEPS
jgi:glutamate 5-kinase